MENIYKRSGGYYAESGRLIGKYLEIIDPSKYQVTDITESVSALLGAKVSKKLESSDKKLADSEINIVTSAGTFQANEKSKAKISAISSRAERVGAAFTVEWIDSNNAVITLTQAEIFELADAITDRDSSAALASNVQKAEIEALLTYADVINYIV